MILLILINIKNFVKGNLKRQGNIFPALLCLPKRNLTHRAKVSFGKNFILKFQ